MEPTSSTPLRGMTSCRSATRRFARVDGGSGDDTLALDGNGITLDLTAIADNRLRGIESIDITGSGDNTLIVDVLEVLNLSDTSNTLTVTGNAGDFVDIGPGWTRHVSAGGKQHLTQGAATLLVSSDVFTTSPAVIELESLDGTNGFRLNGVDAGDQSGRSVSTAGDVNRDGYADILVGAPAADSWAGETFVVFGGGNGFAASLDLASLNGSNGFRLDGIDADDHSGESVSTAGDVNGDGYSDILVGAPQANSNGNNTAGETYVIFGSGNGFSASLDLSTLDGSNGFRLDGIDVDDHSGFFVGTAGDVNGDGYSDILVGAFLADANGKPAAGETYVVFGTGNGFESSLDLSTLDGTNGFRLDGINVADVSGYSLSSAGDVNGDGYADILVGAKQADPGGVQSAGETYVVFGSGDGFASSLSFSHLNGTNGFQIDGIDVEDQSGRSVSTAGDVNGDGYDDILVGANKADPGGDNYAGEAYVVFGRGNGFEPRLGLDTLDGTNGFRLDGIDPGDWVGRSLSTAGDFNGDGFADILIGSSPGGNNWDRRNVRGLWQR